MAESLHYHEKISSRRTMALFLALMLLFLLLFYWRVKTGKMDALAVTFFCLFILFLFYVVNYRTLIITLSAQALTLKFGLFTWTVPLGNVEACRIDEIPLFKKLGGAGIHFMFVDKRYRASFNFLEYPRVVIAFKKKVGPVQDISFSTRQPEDILRLIQAAIAAKVAA